MIPMHTTKFQKEFEFMELLLIISTCFSAAHRVIIDMK